MKRITLEVKKVANHYQATARATFPQVKGRGNTPATAIIDLMHLVGTQKSLWWYDEGKQDVTLTIRRKEETDEHSA